MKYYQYYSIFYILMQLLAVRERQRERQRERERERDSLPLGYMINTGIVSLVLIQHP